MHYPFEITLANATRTTPQGGPTKATLGNLPELTTTYAAPSLPSAFKTSPLSQIYTKRHETGLKMCTAASSSTPRCLNAEHQRSVETVEAEAKGRGPGGVGWGARREGDTKGW